MSTFNELVLLLPECILLFTACAVLVLHLFIQNRVLSVCYFMAQAGVIASIVVVLEHVHLPAVVIFNGHYVFDQLSLLLKLAILVVSFFVFLYSKSYLQDREIQSGEYFALALFSILGMMLLVSAHSLLLVYLGLELVSLPLYGLVALQRDSKTTPEAAMKYFVLGALASGMLLYGMSLIYGVTKTLNHAEILSAMNTISPDYLMVLGLGTVFILVAIAFKLGAAPFHMWLPDIYHGAPTSVTLFIATAPKIAAFGMLIRLLVDALPTLHVQWQEMLMLLSVLSIIIGNVIAIAQSNIKRLFAYSAIAHIGFMLLGVLSGTTHGYSASLFYIIVYALMSAGGFGMIILMSKKGFEAESLDDYRGLNARNPWYAFIMLLLVFSMAGVPPTVGFYAKPSVLEAVVNTGHVYLAIIAILFSVIGAFYYLRIIKLMYFDAPEDPAAICVSKDMAIGISLNGVAILALGLFPSALLLLCSKAFA